MSAFGGKADMTFAGSPLSRSLLGVKRTWAGAVRMSAFDPKRHHTMRLILGASNEIARVHNFCRRRGRCMAGRRAGAAGSNDGSRSVKRWLPLEHVDAWRVGEHFVPGLRGGHARRRHPLTRSLFEP